MLPLGLISASIPVKLPLFPMRYHNLTVALIVELLLSLIIQDISGLTPLLILMFEITGADLSSCA